MDKLATNYAGFSTDLEQQRGWVNNNSNVANKSMQQNLVHFQIPKTITNKNDLMIQLLEFQ